MLITDHITTAVPNPLIGENIDELGTRFPDMSEVYAPELQEKVRKAAEKLQIPLQEGVYMQFTGPSYETPAEIRMCRTWGGDAAGMSTACEAVAANHMGMKVCGISCITNLAAGMSKQKLDHKEVQETADRVSRQFKQLVTEVIKQSESYSRTISRVYSFRGIVLFFAQVPVHRDQPQNIFSRSL